MPSARYSVSAPISPHKPPNSLLSYLPSSTVPSSHRTADNYSYTSLINADDDTHSQPDLSDSSPSPRHSEMPPGRLHNKLFAGFTTSSCSYVSRFMHWRWQWAVLFGCLATLSITAAAIAYISSRNTSPSGQLCPIDMAAVSEQYQQLAQHHLLTVRGYRLLQPHSITASTVSTTHRLHEDVTRYRWDARRPHTWWQWLRNSPAVVVMVTEDGEELSSVPSTARNYLRVTQRMLQDMVDNWQPREQLPPYMDILINTDYGDQLRDSNNSASNITPPTTAPIFSSCSTDSSADVPFIYAESWKSGGVYKQVASQLLLAVCHVPDATVTQWTGEECVDVTAFTTQHWAAKQPTAVWRGSTTGGLYTPTTFHTFPRYQLALLSRTNRTGVIDARLTHCTQCEPTDEVEQLLRTQLDTHFQRDLVSAEQLTHYRALLDVDGNSWSSRLPQLLASGAAVLKQSSSYREFWYDLLQPGVHYMTVARELGDVESVAVWSVERGGEVAVNGLQFARRYLTEEAVRLYAQHLLSEYAALLEMPP